MITIVLKGVTSNELLKKINEYIDNNIIQTWEYDEIGDYTAISNQWYLSAWIRPYVIDDSIVKFGIISHRGVDMTSSLYALYHCRFVEMLLVYFDTWVKEINVSPLMIKGIDF